jgi:hypothetical protein
MADKSMSPFSGLDKALLRSTRPPAPAPTKNQQHPEREEPTTTTTTTTTTPAAPSLPSGTLSTTLVEPERRAEEEPQKQVAPVRPYERTSVREDERTPSPLQRRKLVRHPFEFYEDQVEQLRQLSLQAQLRGEKTSMSEMAREAIDTYLEKKKTRTPVR